MAGYIKGIYSYIRPESNTEATPPLSPTTPSAADPPSPTANNVCQLEGNPQEAGYLRRAVTGVASGIYSVGSSTVGAGVSGVKWVAGTTYNVGTGVVGTAGAVVTGTVSTVGAGATTVMSKITTKKKEHSD
ncbi:transmembrane protein 263-like [Portunus trituberculatus]|uniref:transmembrane protein 263-like n=1 Tax=Portunus trituberculatus TaxID=210409 RepID=UPI001E1CC146|nr:transmembrane protein 263-like [Portunus trituberculatus]XP_045128289.1 transmembrane protein 263-like [Portunus trituberculatus]